MTSATPRARSTIGRCLRRAAHGDRLAVTAPELVAEIERSRAHARRSRGRADAQRAASRATTAPGRLREDPLPSASSNRRHGVMRSSSLRRRAPRRRRAEAWSRASIRTASRGGRPLAAIADSVHARAPADVLAEAPTSPSTGGRGTLDVAASASGRRRTDDPGSPRRRSLRRPHARDRTTSRAGAQPLVRATRLADRDRARHGPSPSIARMARDYLKAIREPRRRLRRRHGRDARAVRPDRARTTAACRASATRRWCSTAPT